MNLWHESSERGIIIWIGVPDKPVKASLSFLVLSFPWYRPPRSTQQRLGQVSISKWGKYMVLPAWSPRHCGLKVRADPARALSTVGRSHAENVSTFPSQEAFARVTYFTDTQKPLLRTAQPLSGWPRWAWAHVLEENPRWQLHLPSIHGSRDSFIHHSREQPAAAWHFTGVCVHARVCVCPRTRECAYMGGVSEEHRRQRD